MIRVIFTIGLTLLAVIATPENAPAQFGELHITGFSTYLHSGGAGETARFSVLLDVRDTKTRCCASVGVPSEGRESL